VPPLSQIVTGNTVETQPENRVFYPALDGIRAVAFLLVFFQHYIDLPWGWSGVNIFFVLSGFLITGILYDTKDAPYRARNFYMRRSLRIFPLYYGIFLALLLLQPFVHWKWSLAWLAWPLYVANFLSFLNRSVTIDKSPQELNAHAHLSSARFPRSELYLGHFWSLCVEEQFYLFWPWIVFWVRSRRALLWICGLAVVLVPLARVVTQYMAPTWMLQHELLYRATPFQLDALLLGGLVALLWRGQFREQLIKLARIIAVLGICIAILYIAFTAHATDSNWCHRYQYPSWKFTWGLEFLNVLAAAMILCVLRPGGWMHRFFHLRQLRWLGRLSYGAYVLHDIPYGVYNHMATHVGYHYTLIAEHNDAFTTALALPSTLLLAWLSFRYFETPFLNLKERWTVRSGN
jgi:peptidoglycan/LPS O-acetylase OafA/YrhL